MVNGPMDKMDAVRFLQEIYDNVEKKLNGLPPIMRGRSNLWNYLEALSIAKGAIFEEARMEAIIRQGETVPMFQRSLTLEELRQMDGEPVWIKADHYGTFADVVKIHGKDDGDAFVGFKICYRLQENGHGKTWIAYRHKPKNE